MAHKISHSQDYYPFGTPKAFGVPTRTWDAESSYRFGFNGMEKDDEMKGAGNSYDFGARMLDPRLCRWWSVDPIDFSFPYSSPYVFASNMPTIAIDPDGKIVKIIITDKAKAEEAVAVIQSLTSDKVKYNSKTGLLKIKEVKKGPLKPSTMLIRDACKNPKVVKIDDHANSTGVASKHNNSFVADDSEAASTPFKGSGGTIYLKFDEEGCVKGSKVEMDNQINKISGGRVLAHELIHFLHAAAGIVDDTPVTENGRLKGDPELPIATISNEEMSTRREENKMFPGEFQRPEIGVDHQQLRTLPRDKVTLSKMEAKDESSY